MGFAAHFRYNWMEPIVYKSILYIPIILVVNLEDVFVHFISIAIGHLNHANLGWDYGLLRYIFNNPKMHIWHHSKEIPNKYGVNFGISLSIWDYLFNTNYIPKKQDIELGFNDEQQFQKILLSKIISIKNN
jgi:sterol desaturase/sphingolipid hydroxylase (fatty acid hydroxylase superfamily)